MRRLALCVVLVSALLASTSASAQDRQKYVGGGLSYNIDAQPAPFGLQLVAWIPVEGPKTPFRPLVIVPRFTDHFGLDYIQFDLDAVWDIPVTSGNIHPYLGMGVGLNQYRFGGGDNETTPVLNFDAGLRYRKPGSKPQFLVETHYSSGLDFTNEMLINFSVLVPFGK
jgi:hypothetical protein